MPNCTSTSFFTWALSLLVSTLENAGQRASGFREKQAPGRSGMQETLWKAFALRTERLWEHSVGLLLFYVVGQPLLEVGRGDRIPLKLNRVFMQINLKKKRLQI